MNSSTERNAQLLNDLVNDGSPATEQALLWELTGEMPDCSTINQHLVGGTAYTDEDNDE